MKKQNEGAKKTEEEDVKKRASVEVGGEAGKQLGGLAKRIKVLGKKTRKRWIVSLTLHVSIEQEKTLWEAEMEDLRDELQRAKNSEKLKDHSGLSAEDTLGKPDK